MNWDMQALTERFAALAGMEQEEAQRHSLLCRDAAAQVEGMAKSSLTAQEEELLHGAAAALAFYRWALLEGVRAPESFASGEIQVKKDIALSEKARKIWKNTETLRPDAYGIQILYFSRCGPFPNRELEYKGAEKNGMSGLRVDYAIRKYGSPVMIRGKETRALLRPLRKTQENTLR